MNDWEKGARDIDPIQRVQKELRLTMHTCGLLFLPPVIRP
jgi:hypothetical protein